MLQLLIPWYKDIGRGIFRKLGNTVLRLFVPYCSAFPRHYMLSGGSQSHACLVSGEKENKIKNPFSGIGIESIHLLVYRQTLHLYASMVFYCHNKLINCIKDITIQNIFPFLSLVKIMKYINKYANKRFPTSVMTYSWRVFVGTFFKGFYFPPSYRVKFNNP